MKLLTRTAFRATVQMEKKEKEVRVTFVVAVVVVSI
jgi:hypothetical protein